ncbi:MAG TPA: PilN domain-containing protein [Tepidisphaeraceae bacterium]|jgi:Tfp pilus assembly protein PilN
MRELEFLPDWYPRTRRRRRMVVLQGWLILVLIAGMGTWVVLKDRNIADDERVLAAQASQLAQTYAQLAEVDKLDAMRRQLRQQERIVSRLGFAVEACKAVNALDEKMPKQMALTNIQLENEEKIDNSAFQAARTPGELPPAERRLKVRIQGVCPTDVDLANFMTQLSTVPFFESVNNTYARDRLENDHVMREFELTFWVNLGVVGS